MDQSEHGGFCETATSKTLSMNHSVVILFFLATGVKYFLVIGSWFCFVLGDCLYLELYVEQKKKVTFFALKHRLKKVKIT